MKNKSITRNLRLRYNIITTIVYIVGIILLFQLFNLQIIHGEEYREESNNKLTRESTLKAARGSILDRSGNVLASTTMGFSLDLYKTKITNEALNESILNMTRVLEANGDRYIDSFPITLDPFTFNFSTEEALASWKKTHKINENMTPEECFYFFKDKYEIEVEDLQEIRNIIRIRYEITTKGYSNTRSIEIANRISKESAIQFNERSNEFPGLNVTVESQRTYTSQTLASHIIGYIGRISNEEELKEKKKIGYEADDDIGKIGVEYVLEKYLKGQNGVKQIDMSVDGTIIGEYAVEEAISGNNVVLSIDSKLQEIAENTLEANINKIRNGGFGRSYNANSGAVVVMKVQTGEVLAMASFPDFEPQDFVGGISTQKWNEYTQNETNPLFNRAAQGAFAPGSIFKMITGIAALESGAITRNEKVQDLGVFPYSYRPRCWMWTDYRGTHGWLNMSEAIKHSCNFYFYEMGRRMGVDTIEKYARYFGLGEKTGIEINGETTGTVVSQKEAQKEERDWSLGDTLSAAIGQSYNNYSPIQIAKYVSMLANGGHKINPTIIKSIITSEGKEISKEEIRTYTNQLLNIPEDTGENLEINQDNLNSILEGMRDVTSDTGGTAYVSFKNFDISVGGKTGSAETSIENKTNAWFVGFAPFEAPEIAVVVLVEGGGHGSYTAEVVRDLIAEYFGLENYKITENMIALPYTQSTR